MHELPVLAVPEPWVETTDPLISYFQLNTFHPDLQCYLPHLLIPGHMERPEHSCHIKGLCPALKLSVPCSTACSGSCTRSPARRTMVARRRKGPDKEGARTSLRKLVARKGECIRMPWGLRARGSCGTAQSGMSPAMPCWCMARLCHPHVAPAISGHNRKPRWQLSSLRTHLAWYLRHKAHPGTREPRWTACCPCRLGEGDMVTALKSLLSRSEPEANLHSG